MSTTTNLKLFKHDNPTTNTNQFDVEKALNENWDKIDKNVGEVANKIQTLENETNAKDTSLESEIKALKEENAIFRSQFPSATVTGKSIRLTDSSNMPCQITPLGASIQEGTPSIESEAPIESVGDNINYFPTDESEWEQGAISSSTGENASNTVRLRTRNFIEKPSNQCHVSIQNTNYVFVNIIMYDESGAFIGAYGDIDYSIVGSTSLAVTFTDECKKIKAVIKKANDSTILPSEILTIKAKLEKGTKTQYSPYGQGSIGITIGDGTTSQTKVLYTQQPFRAIGDVKDRFVKVDRVWYEEHSIARRMFNGSEPWYITNTANGISSFNYTSTTIKAKSIIAISNMLKYNADIWNIEAEDDVVKVRNTLDGINVIVKGITTLDELKTKLVELHNAGTPLYVDYVLETPTLIECTPEQVEELESFNTYKNVTDICTDSIGELEIFYYKDLETLLGGA